MKRLPILLVVLASLISATTGFGQQTDLDVWIDTNQDGLPGGPAKTLNVGVPDSFRVYYDTGASVWTNFLFYASFGPGPDSTSNFFEADTFFYAVGGGTLFAADIPPSGTRYWGLGGSGFASLTGVLHIATVFINPIRTSLPGAACITPVLDAYASGAYVACQMGAGQAYGLFTTGTSTPGCYTNSSGASATEVTSWGKVKGLFR